MTLSKSLQKHYRKYQKNKKQNSGLDFLRVFMPEIVFRTTKLEGEPVTRKMVKAIFGR